MRNSHSSRLLGMFELLMTSSLCHFKPTSLQKLLNHLSTAHPHPIFKLYTSNTHRKQTKNIMIPATL